MNDLYISNLKSSSFMCVYCEYIFTSKISYQVPLKKKKNTVSSNLLRQFIVRHTPFCPVLVQTLPSTTQPSNPYATTPLYSRDRLARRRRRKPYMASGCDKMVPKWACQKFLLDASKASDSSRRHPFMISFSHHKFQSQLQVGVFLGVEFFPSR